MWFVVEVEAQVRAQGAKTLDVGHKRQGCQGIEVGRAVARHHGHRRHPLRGVHHLPIREGVEALHHVRRDGKVQAVHLDALARASLHRAFRQIEFGRIEAEGVILAPRFVRETHQMGVVCDLACDAPRGHPHRP